MTKGEVAGLQAIAQKNGTTLTINPQTGLPEAFSLKSLIPMAAGAALTIGSGGALSPLAAGMMVGGGYWASTGSLKQGLMAGLGAYGGAGLGAGIGAAGTQEVAGEAIAKEAAENQAKELAAQQAAAAETANAAQAANIGAPGVYTSAPSIPYDAANAADMSYITPANQLPASTYGATATPDQLTAFRANTGAGDLMSRGFSSLGTEAGRNAAISGMGGGMQAAKYGVASLAPAVGDAMTPKPIDPLAKDTDMGQRFSYQPGYPDGKQGYTMISNEEAKKLYGYAGGGPVEAMSNANAIGANMGYPMANVEGRAYATPYQMPMSQNMVHGAADTGINQLTGEMSFAEGGMTYDPVTQQFSGGESSAGIAPLAAGAAPTMGYRYDPLTQRYTGSAGDTNYLGGGQYGQAEVYDPGFAAGGGISTLGGYSDGGRLLKGPGDGMSDNIPARIGAKQPARLADGEFVVPADVVSHLGNGSTDAGAKQLYKMMDKIRTARTGRKAQGKQINPNKFVPA
jgi:hypothetical protein